MNSRFLTLTGLGFALTCASVFATDPIVPIIIVEEKQEEEKPKIDQGAIDQKKNEDTASKKNGPTDDASPSNQAAASTGTAVNHVQQAVQFRVTVSGMESKEIKEVTPTEPCVWFCNPRVFAEYKWINSHDDRPIGPDGDTHSVTGGLTFTTIGGIDAGLLYAYSRQDLNDFGAGIGSVSDAHFVSLYAAKGFLKYFYAGVTGGYGHTDVQSFRRAQGFTGVQDIDTWFASPLLGAVYVKGAFQGAANVAYIYTHNDGDVNDSDDGKMVYSLNLGYAVTERLTVTALGKFTQMVHYEDAPAAFPEDREWWTVGGRVDYRPLERLGIYASYEYDINDNYSNHTVTGGLSYSF